MVAPRRAFALALCALSLTAAFPAIPAGSPIPPIEGVQQPHPPIAIRGDAGFLSPLSGVRSGSGTAEDPYVISGWRIVGGRSAILLEGTRAHVRIEDVSGDDWTGEIPEDPDCVLEWCPWALVVAIDASNITIQGVTGRLSRIPLYARDSFDISISDVNLPSTPAFGSPTTGLDLARVQRLDAARITITASRPAILYDVKDVTIRDSTFNLPTGIPLLSLNYGTLSVGPSESVSIVGNTFNRLGMYVWSAAYDLYVADNHFLSASTAFTYSADSDITRRTDSISICGNTFMNNGAGVEVFGVWDLDMRGNTFRRNGIAGWIFPWQGYRHLAFEGNRVENNTEMGLLIGGAQSRVHHNRFVGNAEGEHFYGNASLNWWGHESGPGPVAGSGSGDRLRMGSLGTFTPWLTSPPPVSSTCERNPVTPVPPLIANTMAIDYEGPQAIVVKGNLRAGLSMRAEARYDLASYSGAPYGFVLGSYNASDPNYLLGVYSLGRDDRTARLDVDQQGSRIVGELPIFGPSGFSMSAGTIQSWGLDSVLLLAAATDPIVATHLTVTVYSEEVVDPADFVEIRATSRTGYATLDHFEGDRIVVRAPGAAVTRMEEGWLNLTSTSRMMLATEFGPDFSAPPAAGVFTIESPDHSGDATGIFDMNATAGEHRFRVQGIDSMSPYDAPRILWADLDGRFT